MTAKHTALPWYANDNIVATGGVAIAECSSPERAALIVQAVNNYDAALARVKELEGTLKSIAENKLTGPSPIGPAHGAGISMGIEIQASIARSAIDAAKGAP